jgi:hypothetical protein
MKKFIYQTTLSLLIVALLIVGFNLLTLKFVNKKASFKLAANIDRIVVGHSHPESAYNDSVITNLRNVAQSGESYFYSYFKIKQLVKQNIGLKYIFLEFTNNHLAEEMDEWIWSEKTLAFRYPTYSPFIDYDGYKLLLRKNFGELLSLQVKSLMKNAKAIATNNYDYVKKTGGYFYLTRDKTDSLLSALGNKKKDIPATKKQADYNLDYLDKIIALCKKQNITLYLIRSPMHPKVTNLVNEQVFKQVLTARFNSLEFLDFKNFTLPNHDFGDFSHLNYRGAKKYSIFFNDLLEKGLLMKSNKQHFIDSLLKTN